METLNELLKDKPLLPRLHWLPRFMDRVMVGACIAGGVAIGYMIYRSIAG